jgi:hypothetical protein
MPVVSTDGDAEAGWSWGKLDETETEPDMSGVDILSCFL